MPRRSDDDADFQTLVRRQVKAWLAGDAEAAAADFSTTGVFISPGGTWRGPDGVRAAVHEFLKSATVVDITVRRVFRSGGQGAVEWVWSERQGDDSEIKTMEDAIVFEVDETGRIAYWREYFDPNQTEVRHL